eukprot:3937123-Rhodomonas_salina.3
MRRIREDGGVFCTWTSSITQTFPTSRPRLDIHVSRSNAAWQYPNTACGLRVSTRIVVAYATPVPDTA